MEGVSGQATGAVARACRIMWTERSVGTFWPFGSVCSSRHYRRSSLYYSAVTVLPLLESKCIPWRSRDFRSLSRPSLRSPGWGKQSSVFTRFQSVCVWQESGREYQQFSHIFWAQVGFRRIAGGHRPSRHYYPHLGLHAQTWVTTRKGFRESFDSRLLNPDEIKDTLS